MKKYLLRLFNDGSWELFDEGHITCMGRKWDASMATHLRVLMMERDGTNHPIISRPPPSSDPVDINTFLKRMGSC